MSKIFWRDGFEGKASGGYYFRAFDLVKFFKRLEDDGKEVVGLEFDGNNVNVIVESKSKEDKLFDDLLKQEEEYNKQENNDED